MAQKSSRTPMSKIRPLDTQTKFNEDLGREITWFLVQVPLKELKLNALNNRFAPDAELSEEEHEEAVISEDPHAFENLKKSWDSNPQFEQLIGFTKPNMDGFYVIAGHRRTFAARQSGAETVLMWVAEGLSENEVEHIRDWPEIHTTKVPHASFAKFKSIYSDLAGTDDLEKERRIVKWKKKGFTRPQILKAERVFGRLSEFCKSIDVKPHTRADQIKAFETYDSICESTFHALKDRGEFQRVLHMDKVAKAFLKQQLAHDDLKVAVEGMADLPPNDPVFKAIETDPTYLDDTTNLRRLTELARTQRNSESIIKDVQEFTMRTFAKLIDRADATEIDACIEEFKDAVQRLEAARSNLRSSQ